MTLALELRLRAICLVPGHRRGLLCIQKKEKKKPLLSTGTHQLEVRNGCVSYYGVCPSSLAPSSLGLPSVADKVPLTTRG